MIPSALAALLAAASPARDSADAGVKAPSPITAKYPVDISSDHLHGEGKKQKLLWLGHVKVKRGTTNITCDRLVAHYTQAQEVKRGECDGNVEVLDQDKWAKGDHADFDNTTGILIVTGNPEAKQGFNHVRGTKVIFSLDEDIIDVDDATAVLKKPLEGADAGTRSAASPMTGTHPLQIAADRLHIERKKQEALWRGHVKVKRGTTNISCNRLVAHYTQDQEVSRVECMGNVEVLAEDKWAKGDHADFDNLTGILIVTGNPEAKQGGNHVRGTKVVFRVDNDVIEVDNATALLKKPPEGGSSGGGKAKTPR
jgi:lipopolysaccharide export system protein LptA